MSKMISALTLVAIMILSTAASAQPVENVSGRKHPNVAAAQHLTDAAFKKIVAAQQANEFDLAGHAQRAKDLLDQANNELKAAAETSNSHH